jgi:hypothetical protein
MSVATQVHEHFKLFAGKLDASGDIKDLADTVRNWVAEAKVAPKSIGIEFIERSKTILLSIGYRETSDEAPYAVELASTKICQVQEVGPEDLARIERGLAAAASTAKNVICHELYVTDQDDLFMVTMAKV